MGTIVCTVNGNDGVLTFDSISGQVSSSTWAKFNGVSFEIAGGGTFTFALTVQTAFSDFRFNPSDPIGWGPSGPPTWLQITGTTTATSLTLEANSNTVGTSVFTILNATTGGASVGVVLVSAGGSGGAGGTVAAYVQNHHKVLIGPLPAGALAAGRQVTFGLRDGGNSTILLTPAEGTEILGLTWKPSKPDFIQIEGTNGQPSILVDNQVGDPPPIKTADFTIQTNFGPIDPTIITNPDEGGPQ